MTDGLARVMIAERLGGPMATTSGVPGSFYTTVRERDVREAVRAVLDERGETG